MSQLDLFAPHPIADRATTLRAARVYLAQVPTFRDRRQPFAFVLLEWAAKCRRAVMGAE